VVLRESCRNVAACQSFAKDSTSINQHQTVWSETEPRDAADCAADRTVLKTIPTGSAARFIGPPPARRDRCAFYSGS
jgi:hypothetical protein